MVDRSVTPVEPESPADEAELISGEDFVIYNLTAPYQGLDSFCDQCSRLFGSVKSIKLVVYNLNYNEVRVVSILPNDSWSQGRSWLGCEFGAGIMDKLQNVREAKTKREEEIEQTAERLEDPDYSLRKKKSSHQSYQEETLSPGVEPEEFYPAPIIPAALFIEGKRIKNINACLEMGGISFKIEDSSDPLVYSITQRNLIRTDRTFVLK